MAAIYQWFERVLQVITTMLYPIEIYEKLQTSVSLIFGSMTQIPSEVHEVHVISLDGNIVTLLLTAPMQDEIYDMDVIALDGNIVVLLLTAPTDEPQYEMDVIALDGSIREALVPALMPDEGLHFGCSLISGSMTHV